MEKLRRKWVLRNKCHRSSNQIKSLVWVNNDNELIIKVLKGRHCFNFFSAFIKLFRNFNDHVCAINKQNKNYGSNGILRVEVSAIYRLSALLPYYYLIMLYCSISQNSCLISVWHWKEITHIYSSWNWMNYKLCKQYP